MTTTITKWRCTNCRIRFNVREKPDRAWASEYTICVQPGCSQRFWHGGHNGGVEKLCCLVGIDRQDIPDDAMGERAVRETG